MFTRFAFLLVLSACALQVRAASTVNDPSVWNYLKYQKQYAVLDRMRTIFPTNPSGTEWVIPSAPTLINSPGGGVDIKNTANVPVGGKSVPVTAVKNASNAAIATAAGGVLRNAARIGVPAVGALATAVAVKDMYDLAKIYFDPEISTPEKPLYKNQTLDGARESDGYTYYVVSAPAQTSGSFSPSEACNRFAASIGNATGSARAVVNYWVCTIVKKLPNGNTDWVSDYNIARGGTSSCPAGYFILSNGVCSAYGTEKKPLTAEEIDQLIAQNQFRADQLQELINQDKEHERRNGIDPFGYQSPKFETSQPVVSGPASSPGSTSTTSKETTVSQGTTQPTAPGTPGAQPATQTTTTTTTNNYTYNNNVVNNTITTITTTTIKNNVTGETSPPTTDTETTDKPDQEEEVPPVDTPLGEIPKLYERKYPEGLVGIWNTKSEQIKQASVFTLAAQLMPTGLDAGTCPSWPIVLEFASWASYGEHDFAPPCWIWDVAKGIIIVSALMLARSLIFGG